MMAITAIDPDLCYEVGLVEAKLQNATFDVYHKGGLCEPALSCHLKLQVGFKPFCLNADNLLKVLSCINVVMAGTAFLI